MSIEQSNSTTKLPLFLTPQSMKLKYSSHHQQYSSSSGVLTPPIHTCLASVPFKWELHPGKPRPYCTDIIISFNDQPKFLEPPPRFYYLDKMTKIPSSPKLNVLHERGQLGTLVLYKHDDSTNNNVSRRGSYWWQQWFVKRRITKENGVGRGNLVISADCGTDAGLERNGNLSGFSHPNIWASMYEGFKNLIPWKSKKSKKEIIKIQT
uniref:Uncharacterized protein n=1 Tax=Solanum lycopersicum TaxID=4081 RepID=A0A3Q7ICW2_SOLLC|nr:uncharacterized protein LOC101265371 [Solanum lycopersicum]